MSSIHGIHGRGDLRCGLGLHGTLGRGLDLHGTLGRGLDLHIGRPLYEICVTHQAQYRLACTNWHAIVKQHRMVVRRPRLERLYELILEVSRVVGTRALGREAPVRVSTTLTFIGTSLITQAIM